MTTRYLLDENVDTELAAQLERHVPGVQVRIVGEEGTPPRRSPDPALLVWCEEHQFSLVTLNRRTMPVHLADHQMAGRHVPGVFVWGKGAGFGHVLADLIVIALVAEEGEFADRITYLPLQPESTG